MISCNSTFKTCCISIKVKKACWRNITKIFSSTQEINGYKTEKEKREKSQMNITVLWLLFWQTNRIKHNTVIVYFKDIKAKVGIVTLWGSCLDGCWIWTPSCGLLSVDLLRVPARLLIHKPGVSNPYDEIQETKYLKMFRVSYLKSALAVKSWE